MIDWLLPKKAAPPPPTMRIAGRDLPIVLNRHPTAKRLVLRLAPDGSALKVTLPRWSRSSDAVDFAHSRAAWVERQLAAFGDVATEPVPHYRGRQLIVEWQPHLPRRAKLSGDMLQIGGPEDIVTRRVQRWLETRALELMEVDSKDYCMVAGLPPAPIRISRARRRWGSCSSKGTLRLNWRLVQAPDLVRRSVVAHEVAHLVHFDHSPQFHDLLGKLFEGDIAQANSWLKAHGRSLYALDRIAGGGSGA